MPLFLFGLTLYTIIMDVEKLLNTIVRAGSLLIESGAEVYRVEETMVRMTHGFKGVEFADSYVTVTGIMFSLTVDHQTVTKIVRIKNRSVDLNCIDQINSLSRRVCEEHMSVDELADEISKIENHDRYSFFVTTLFGAVGAAGFGIFFDGNVQEVIASFIIGILIRCVSYFLEKRKLNPFFVNMLSAGVAAMSALFIHGICKVCRVDVMIISSIMLLVPGLAFTNAVRDTVAGDYISGMAKMTEAFLTAIAIAIGCGFVLFYAI